MAASPKTMLGSTAASRRIVGHHGSMASQDVPRRLLDALEPNAWRPTSELASAAKVSRSTARKHLSHLLVQGSVERRDDPFGNSGYTWRQLDPPIGMASPTIQMLCRSCAMKEYRDIVRYREALTSEAFDRWMEAGDHIGDDENLIPPCDQCGQPIA
jgi:hypothetical protein